MPRHAEVIASLDDELDLELRVANRCVRRHRGDPSPGYGRGVNPSPTERPAIRWLLAASLGVISCANDAKPNAKLANDTAAARSGAAQPPSQRSVSYPAAFCEQTLLASATAVVCDSEQVTDLSPLSGLTQLQELSLDGTKVSDLSPLRGLTQLQQLSLNGTDVADLRPLEALTKLRILYVGASLVLDLTPLERLTQLEKLSLFQTKVKDLAPLKSLARLESLALGRTEVSDLTPLGGLTQLRVLDLTGTRTSAEHVAALKAALPKLQIEGP